MQKKKLKKWRLNLKKKKAKRTFGQAVNASRRSSIKKTSSKSSKKKEFPTEFPFWGRLKINKHRTTLVIDEEKVLNKRNKKLEDGFVHREATSKNHKGFEEISPNPDKDKRPNSMYLKSPRKIPKRLIEPHNKQLEMPVSLKDRYSKNNKK